MRRKTYLKEISYFISFNLFQATDVVRHPVVQRIVQAYEIYEREQDRQQAQAEQKKQAEANP